MLITVTWYAGHAEKVDPQAVIALHLPPSSNSLSMCLCAVQVQQALETGDPQAVMALRDQLEDVVSSKREQEGELQARLQVGSPATIRVIKNLCHAAWAQAGRGQSYLRVSWDRGCLLLKPCCKRWQAAC